jgi:hypothetical protein
MLMRLPPLLAVPGERSECSMIFTATGTAFQRPAQHTARQATLGEEKLNVVRRAALLC